MRIRQKYKTLRFLFGSAPSHGENIFPHTDTFAREEYDQHTRLISFIEMYLSEMKRLTGELVSLHDKLYSIMHGNHLNTRCFADLPHMELSWIQRVLLALKSEVDQFDKQELHTIKDSFMQCDIKLKRLDMCGAEKERYETKVEKLEIQCEGHMKCNKDKKLLRNRDKLQTAKGEYELALINSRGALQEITDGERRRFAAFVCNTIRSIVRGLNIPALLAEETEDVARALRKCKFPSRNGSPLRISPPRPPLRSVPVNPRELTSSLPMMYDFEEKLMTPIRPRSLSMEYNNIENDGKLGLPPNGNPLDKNPRSVVPDINNVSLFPEISKKQEEETVQVHTHAHTACDKNNDRAHEDNIAFVMEIHRNGKPAPSPPACLGHGNNVSFGSEKKLLEMDESDAIVDPRDAREEERSDSHSFFPLQPYLEKSACDVRGTTPTSGTSSMPRVGTAETMAPSADNSSSSSSPHDHRVMQALKSDDTDGRADATGVAIVEHLGRKSSPLHLYFPPSPHENEERRHVVRETDEENKRGGRRRIPRRRRWSHWSRQLEDEDIGMGLGGPQQSHEEGGERERRKSDSTASTTSERGRLKVISRTRERISRSWSSSWRRRFRRR